MPLLLAVALICYFNSIILIRTTIDGIADGTLLTITVAPFQSMTGFLAGTCVQTTLDSLGRLPGATGCCGNEVRPGCAPPGALSVRVTKSDREKAWPRDTIPKVFRSSWPSSLHLRNLMTLMTRKCCPTASQGPDLQRHQLSSASPASPAAPRPAPTRPWTLCFLIPSAARTARRRVSLLQTQMTIPELLRPAQSAPAP